MLKLKKNVYFFLLKIGLVLVGLFPLLPFHKKPSIVFFLLLISILSIIKFPKVRFHFHYVVNASIAIISILSLIYTENLAYGINKSVKLLPLLVFPLACYFFTGIEVNKINFKNIEKFFFTIFFISMIIYALLMYYYIYRLGYFADKVSYGFSLSYVQRRFFWGLREHPIYISLYLAIAILFSIKLFFMYKKWLYKSLIIFGSLLLLSTLFFLSRKGVIIGLIMAIIPLFLFKDKWVISKKTGVLFIAIILGFLFALKVSPLSKRFSELVNTSFLKDNEVIADNSTSIRAAIYKCAINSIEKAGIFGLGAGDVQEELCVCYEETSPILSIGKYNTHNQFLNMWLSYGIVGLLIFLYLIYRNFHLAFSQKDTMFLSILIIISVVLLVENILNRQNGILIFGLLINYFSFKNLTIKKMKNHRL